jgi:regulator of protease activity HflC (stomatin/prohibitin superfamily)
MFDRLIDLFLQSIAFFIPFVVIDQFERAVVLRFGRYHRTLEPGFHWIIPCSVEAVIADNVVPRTTNLQAQSLTTADDRQVVVAGVVTSQITDIVKATLEVEGVDHALQDACYGAIGSLVAASTYEQINDPGFSHELTKACRRQAKAFGIEIMRVQLSDLTRSTTLRLLNA